MTKKQHAQRHVELHKALDELFADYIAQHPEQFSFTQTPIIDLIKWSSKQLEEPDHDDPKIKIRKGLESL